MDNAAIRTLLRRAESQLEQGQYKACQATLDAAKALKAQQAGGENVEQATKRMINELGRAIGDGDPSYFNRDIAGLPPLAGGNPWPGHKNNLQPPTIALSDKEAESLHNAATSRQSMRVNLKHRTKLGPTGPIIGQPPAAVPHGVPPRPFAREPSRILDLIPFATSPGAYLQYFATAGGTAAAAVAEGTMKPESFPRWTRIDARATKIATFVEASDESITDFPNFLTLVEADLMAGVIDAENREILSAVSDPVTHGWNGLLHTSGTLSRTRTTET